MAIRSGRFIGDATQTLVGTKVGLPIIDGHGGTYRIFNSGFADFVVAIKGQPNVVLPSDCSVDVRPGNGDIFIKRVPRGEKMVEGIYEFLSNRSEVRSGRFSKSNGKLTLVSESNARQASVFYRVINSGDDLLTVNRLISQVSTFVTQLRPKTSIDIELAGNGLEVQGTLASKGIYFRTDLAGDVKSGRFKMNPKIANHPKPNLLHPIISTLPNPSKSDAYYRVFNSGDHSFLLKGLDLDVTIAKGMSYDFKIDKLKAVISVQGLNDFDAIEGSFDFVEAHAD